MKKGKNKIYTSGYFIKRLKDSGFIVWKIFNNYSENDSRYWTILVNPGQESVYITCHINRNELNTVLYEIYDSGNIFKRNLFIATESIEIIINKLIQSGISNNTKNNQFFKKT